MDFLRGNSSIYLPAVPLYAVHVIGDGKRHSLVRLQRLLFWLVAMAEDSVNSVRHESLGLSRCDDLPFEKLSDMSKDGS